jgi:DNA (cytosine-5)-methyltransferase 1
MITGIDLFCGAGLWSHALAKAGMHVVCGIDADPVACMTYRANHPTTACIESDIRDVDFDAFAGVDVVVGSPPCVTFSCGAGSARRDCDLALHFARAVHAIRPQAFLLENVPEFRTFPSYREMLRRLNSYVIYEYIADSADFGVPQRRRRLFVIGASTMLPTLGREPTRWRCALDILDPLAPLNDIARLKECTRRRISSVPETRFILVYYSSDARGWQSCQAPLRTVTTVNKFLLVDVSVGGARMLTEQELRRAMDIPESYIILGNARQRLRQIGNAVVPSVACTMATIVRKALFDNFPS